MIWQLLFHMLVLSLTGFGIFYDYKYVTYPESPYNWHMKFGGKLKFLSIQNMYLQFIYFLTALMQDLLAGCIEMESLNALITFNENYFAGLAFPLSIFVTINFWILFYTKRELIFPAIFQQAVPYWHLHILHTNVSVYMLMEMFLSFRVYPEFCTGLITILSYMLIYIIWLHFVKYFAGFWVYPLLNDKGFKELYTYFGSALGQVVVIYMLGEILNNAVWSYELMHKNCVINKEIAYN